MENHRHIVRAINRNIVCSFEWYRCRLDTRDTPKKHYTSISFYLRYLVFVRHCKDRDPEIRCYATMIYVDTRSGRSALRIDNTWYNLLKDSVNVPNLNRFLYTLCTVYPLSNIDFVYSISKLNYVNFRVRI